MAGKKKPNSKNEKIKKRYEKYLKTAGGYDDKSITIYMNAIQDYEDCTGNEDFEKFNDRKAEKFVKYLKNKKNKTDDTPISLNRVKNKLSYVQDFFKWLSMQTGYKRAINLEYVQCLRLSNHELNMIETPTRDKYPTLDMVLKVLQSIPNNELGMRDKALISFILVTGGRNASAASFPIGCLNLDILEADFDPTKGVKTKYRKHYIAYMFRFKEILFDYIKHWYNYLIKEKLYTPQAPLFPKTNVVHNRKTRRLEVMGVKPECWKSDSSIENIFKKRFKEAGIEYYPPHCLKHLADALARPKCRTADDLRALAQNLGHKYVITCLSSYAKLPTDRQREIISRMDFSDNIENKTVDQLSTAELSVILSQRLAASGNSF